MVTECAELVHVDNLGALWHPNLHVECAAHNCSPVMDGECMASTFDNSPHVYIESVDSSL